MCAIIIRSPVIIRRPIVALTSSFGIDSQRCSWALRSTSMVAPVPESASDGNSYHRVARDLRRPVGVDGDESEEMRVEREVRHQQVAPVEAEAGGEQHVHGRAPAE